MPLTLSSQTVIYGFAFSAVVFGRVPGDTLSLTGNPNGKWRLAGSLLTVDGFQPGDTPVEITQTVNGISTPYQFVIGLTGGPSTLAISGSPASGTVGSSASFAPTISGGVGPYSLSSLGMLPPGRSVSGLAVAGTYASSGYFLYALVVTDSTGATARLYVSESVANAGNTPANALTYQGNVLTYQSAILTRTAA